MVEVGVVNPVAHELEVVRSSHAQSFDGGCLDQPEPLRRDDPVAPDRRPLTAPPHLLKLHQHRLATT
jgi:hypothetical protein